MPSNSSGSSRHPICPTTPKREWNQAPHRDLPPRSRQAFAKPPRHDTIQQKKTPSTDWDIFRSIIEKHRELRHEALDTIKLHKPGSADPNPELVQQAREYLNTWRATFIADIQKALGDFLDKLPRIPGGNDYKPFQQTPGQPAQTRTFEKAVDLWRTKNATRLKAMTTAELRANYLASRVLRHAPDLMAASANTDIQNTTMVAAMAQQAFHVLKDDLSQDGNDQIIDSLLELPRLPDPIYDETTLEELTQSITFTEPRPPHPSLIIPPITDNLEWSQLSRNHIEANIRAYLVDNRWNTMGAHFGALIQGLNDIALPTLLNDQRPTTEELTPETAVFISLLKTASIPDHTDTPEDLVAWFEELQLWIEENDLKEIPPQTIRQIADSNGVALLEIGQQPSL